MSKEFDPIEKLFERSGIRGGGGSEVNPIRYIFFFFLFAFIVTGLGQKVLTTYTDWLWFTHDAKQPEVFTNKIVTMFGIWGAVFVVSFIVLSWNTNLCLNAILYYFRIPSTFAEKIVVNIIQFMKAKGMVIGKILALVLSYFLANYYSGAYQSYWWAKNAEAFGVTDPLFGYDLSYYVFYLPFFQNVVSFLVSLVLLCLAIVALGYFIVFQIVSIIGMEIGSPFSRRHLHVLTGIGIILLGLNFALGVFDDMSIASSTQSFTGPGYAAYAKMQLQLVASVAFIFVGGIIIANGWIGVAYRSIMFGLPVVLVSWVVVGTAYPAFVQKFIVDPNRIEVEKPYATHAINMSRYAYDLDKIQVKDFKIEANPTKDQLKLSKSTMQNMRLWDPEVIREAFDGKQSLRPYYHFPEVHFDRYNIDGEQTMVTLSPRNIFPSGLVDNAKNWVSMHLRYTHGYGFVASSVHKTNAIGQPAFYVKDMPLQAHKDMEVDNPRIYYSDFRGHDLRFDDPVAYVKTDTMEFDYPSQEKDKDYRWTGDAGVPVGGLLSKLAHAILLKDENLIYSSLIKPETRVLYRRNILLRAANIFPMLDFDSDPYLAIVDRKLMWIIDAYTFTNKIPFSVLRNHYNRKVNYIRNSVKITIDAYSGKVTAYAIDHEEPILKTYMKIFPGLIQPKSSIPDALKAHFRYPENLFELQARTMAKYHVSDPEMFLNNEDVWAISTEMGRDSNSSTRMQPYYVQLRLPDESKDAFMLILPFTPLGKNNMSGWMAANCDPDQYGQMLLYRFPKNNQTAGPNQMEAMFNQNNEISEINRLLDNDQSSIVRGNLLVIPIGTSLLYVKPLFLKSRVNNIRPIPELRKIQLAFQDRVVVGDTYEDALNKLFDSTDLYASDVGVSHSKLKDDTVDSPPVVENFTVKHSNNKIGHRRDEKRVNRNPDYSESGQKYSISEIRKALMVLDQAEKALKNGEFGKYGELQKNAKELLSKIVK